MFYEMYDMLFKSWSGVVYFLYIFLQVIDMCCTGYFHMLCKKIHMLSKKFIYVA